MNEKRMRDWCRIAALGLVFAGAACDEPLAGVPPDMAMAAGHALAMDLPEKVTTPDGATVNLAVGNGIMAWSDFAQQ